MIHLPFESANTLRSARRFAVVGMLGTLIDIVLFSVLHIVLGVPTLAANSLSYTAGGANNFVLHRHWTFAERPRRAVGMQLLQFAVVNLAALVLNNVMLLVLDPAFDTLLHNPVQGDLMAKLIATGVGISWNFLANTFWTFRG